jgi:hypothetical protein
MLLIALIEAPPRDVLVNCLGVLSGGIQLHRAINQVDSGF